MGVTQYAKTQFLSRVDERSILQKNRFAKYKVRA